MDLVVPKCVVIDCPNKSKPNPQAFETHMQMGASMVKWTKKMI